jgi:hypothetical protein
MHELGDFIHGKREVRAGDGSVLEGTNNAMVKCRIVKRWVVIEEERKDSR